MKDEQQFLQDFLGQVQVNVTSFGYQTVWPEWLDLDYVPNYNKFYFIRSGEAYLKIADQVYHPRAGQWYWMPRGVCQSYAAAGGELLTKYWCHFTAVIGDVDLARLLDIPSLVVPRDPEKLAGQFERLIQACTSRQMTAPFLIKAILLELIAEYLDLAGVSQLRLPTSDISGKLEQVVRHIDQHLDSVMSVDDLARIVHLHPNYFSRVFRNHLGYSPIQFINRRRIEKAGYLALTSDDTFSEIARQVGIHDTFYFSRLFKEQTGYAPSEYRKLTRQKGNAQPER